MTKAGLVRILHERHGALNRSEAAATIEALLGVLKRRILGGSRIRITNFGCFEVTRRQRRRGRNPVTGEIISIVPRRTLVFRPARKLDQAIN